MEASKNGQITIIDECKNACTIDNQCLSISTKTFYQALEFHGIPRNSKPGPKASTNIEQIEPFIMTLWDGDIVYVLYRIFLLSPLRLLGRVLWIAVDFVVIERSIIGSISQTSSLLVSAFHRMQEAAWLNYLLLVFVGLLLILINWGYYGHG